MKDTRTASSSNIGKTIKSLRLRKGWKQNDIATRLSISIAAYSKIEAGITIVNLSRLTEIADVLDVTLQFILSSDKETMDLKNQDKINNLREEIAIKEEEYMKLQQTAINLYEELKIKQNFHIRNAG